MKFSLVFCFSYSTCISRLVFYLYGQLFFSNLECSRLPSLLVTRAGSFLSLGSPRDCRSGAGGTGLLEGGLGFLVGGFGFRLVGGRGLKNGFRLMPNGFHFGSLCSSGL